MTATPRLGEFPEPDPWWPREALQGLPGSNPEASPARRADWAVSTYGKWIRTAVLSQASHYALAYLRTVLPGVERADLLGAWSSAMADTAVAWFDPEGPGLTGNEQRARERLLQFHQLAFDSRRTVGVVLHFRPHSTRAKYLTSPALVSRTAALTLSRDVLPQHASLVEEALLQPEFDGMVSDVLELALQRPKHFRILIDAEEESLSRVRLFQYRHRVGLGRALCSPEDAERVLTQLSRELRGETAALAITLAQLDPSCDRVVVFDQKAKALSEAARSAMSETTLNLGEPPEATFLQFEAAWQAVRQEMKPKIEQLIESLARYTFDTFEEKASVAARLNELLDAWSFRAISPSTGRPAYFQCRGGGKRNPRGFFAFEDVSNSSDPVAPVEPNAPRATVRIPPFRLTDAPLNSRTRRSVQNPSSSAREES